MKKRINLILSMTSLFFTAFLLLVTIFGWYVTNSTATASGITASTKGRSEVYMSTAYNGTDSLTTSNYTDYGFSKKVTITHTGALLPASSADASAFYYATTVGTDGTATGTAFTAVSSTEKDYYYIDVNLYIISLETSSNISIYLSNVKIAQGSGTSTTLYKAVRVSTIYNSTATIFKCASGGDAYPAESTNSIASTDTAILAGSVDSNQVSIALDALASESITDIECVTVRIWIEGQNSNAVATNDLSSFTVAMNFDE